MDSIDLSRFSEHSLRILKLALLEADANRNGRGDKINPEHLLIAMCQDGDINSLGFELINNCKLTIGDLRQGNVVPK